MTLVPRTAAPYSRLAMISGVVTLPATRVTKRCPMLWSKTISTGRASRHRRGRLRKAPACQLWSRRICLSLVEALESVLDVARTAVHQGLDGFVGC